MPGGPPPTSTRACPIASASPPVAVASASRPGGAGGPARWIDRAVVVLAVLTAGAICGFLVWAGRYYTLPLWDRPDAPLHRLLRPSGSVGHAVGIAGAAMIVVGVALYSSRKRVGGLQGRGPMRTWLNVHIYLCLTGPVLVTFHTALKFHGLGVYSFWSMMIVAGSGIVGRWLYQQFPRTIKGKEMTLEEIAEEQAEVRARLKGEFALPPDLLASVDAMAERSVRRIQSSAGALALPLLFVDDIARLVRIRALRRRLRRGRHLARHEADTLFALINRQVATVRRIAFLGTFKRFFLYWHVTHLIFFFAMFGLLVMHVAVVVFFGAAMAGG